MARTTQEIFNEIITIKEANQNLSGLTSTSTYAIWRNLYSTVSASISVFEQILDSFKKDLEYQKATTPIYTEKWWNDKMINQFQFDNTDPDKGVIKIDDQFVIGYTTVDESKRIIKFSSTKQADSNRQVTIKVAKGSTIPEQLTEDELFSAASYVDRIKGAGLLINVVSFPADRLKFEIDIYCDGQYVLSTLRDNVKNAITTYLQQLEFDGSIKLSKIVDAIQAIEGINDVYIRKAQALPEGGIYTDFNRVWDTKAGYAILNDTDSLFNMIIGK